MPDVEIRRNDEREALYINGEKKAEGGRLKPEQVIEALGDLTHPYLQVTTVREANGAAGQFPDVLL